MLTLLACLPILAAQDAAPPTPYDRVFELEIAADDPVLIEGKGPTVAVEHEVEFEGTLHVWTRSELELFLQVEDANEWRTLGEDEDSGGGTTPYLRLEVHEGDRLLVLVAGESGVSGVATLHFMAAPETNATLEFALVGQEGLAEARRLQEQGDLDGARALNGKLVDRLTNAPDTAYSAAVASVLWDLGTLASGLGDWESRQTAWSAVRKHRERTLPEDHRDLLRARGNLAATMQEQGDLAGARALQEAVLAASERTLPEDHPDLLLTRGNLAVTMWLQGDLAGARALQEAVLATSERTLPEDHPGLLRTRANLAGTMRKQGDLAGARALQETVLAASERTLPEDHRELLRARANLAVTMQEQGDLAGARALQETVLAASERTLPEEHPELLRARGYLAVTMQEQGDLAGARALQEAVLATSERTLPEDHPGLLVARANLGATMWKQGDLAGARALQEAVLATSERTLPEEHPDLLHTRANLAVTMHQQGDLAGARALQEAVLTASERTLPEDHSELLRARANLAVTMQEQGDLAGVRALVTEQVAGMRARVTRSLALAPRQAREAVGAEAHRLAGVLFSTRSGDPELQQPVFALQETMRLVASEAARALRGSQEPEIRDLLNDAASVRAALGDLAAGAEEGRDAEELTRLMQARDRLEREASRRLAEKGVVTRPIEAARLAEVLGAESALVAYRRIAHWKQDEQSGKVTVGPDHLLVHVLANDGSLVRLDLGEASELEELVVGWRSALGAPLLRGVGLEKNTGESVERGAGEALRARLLDPILALLGEEIRRLYVCADDLVYLVPLEALPLDEGRVGDRWTLVNEVSCARLQEPWEPLDAEPGLLALGGVDYDAGEALEVAASSSRSSLPDRFTPLLQARFEAETTGALFEDLHDVEPVVLTKDKTTKESLFKQAPGKHYVHIATHGWFAPETVKSTLDPEPGGRGWARMGLQERVTGMAPMLLCGLALAGANQPMNSLGRRPGILTAEELCSLDLSSCELAVLSACETNVGIRRAGQGIQSLQAALYAAGARSSITSLWKVDDAATRRLFEIFYTKLWEEQMPKAQALWEAKCVLREEGAPVRDWAGWVLTGDPD